MTDQTEPSATQSVVIERSLTAPRQQVWDMWTIPENFAAWYGPTGATIPVANMDVQVGGRRHICMEMQTPDGPMTMWFAGEFTDVSAIDRLAYTDGMADADGNMMSPADMGMPADHPTHTEVVVELSDQDGGTFLKLTHHGVPADSPGAMGWNMALDKLTAQLG